MRSSRGSRRRHGAATIFRLSFAELFEPAKATAIGQVADRRRIGADHLTMARAATAPPCPTRR